jgi:5-hydroxyisourate hydrolase
MSPITTHVLDTARGKPAAGVGVALEMRGADGSFTVVGSGATDSDGRNRTLLEKGALVRGVYRITFDVQAYFSAMATATFYPAVSVLFEITDPGQHYHVPLLISPFGYSTYRGS